MKGIPTREPAKVAAGDTWRWKRTDLAAEYPASDGWALTYVLLNASAKITFAASADGDAFLIHEAAADTISRAAGSYTWEASVAKGVDRFRVGTGTMEVGPDFHSVASLDMRSHARKALAAIEAVIERRAAKDQQEYAIDGRSLKRTPIADLLVLRDRYKREVEREEQAERLGRVSGRMVVTRFGGR